MYFPFELTACSGLKQFLFFSDPLIEKRPGICGPRLLLLLNTTLPVRAWEGSQRTAIVCYSDTRAFPIQSKIAATGIFSPGAYCTFLKRMWWLHCQAWKGNWN